MPELRRQKSEVKAFQSPRFRRFFSILILLSAFVLSACDQAAIDYVRGAMPQAAAPLVGGVPGATPPDLSLLGPKITSINMTAASLTKLVVGSLTYFVGYDTTHGYELWKTDGTDAGTMMVKDINPGASSSSPTAFASAGGILYFAADDGVHGLELWRSDGTAAGTYMVLDINPGSASSKITGLFVLPNGVLIFSAYDGVNPQNAWRSDGTAAGTYLLGNLSPYNTPVYFTVAGTQVFFSVNNGIKDLGVTDGTTAGTRVIILPGSFGGSAPNFFINLNGKVIFWPRSSPNANIIWTSDGTTAGSVGVSTLGGSNNIIDLKVSNGKLYVSTINGVTYQVWVTDGTGGGTSLLINNADINGGPYDFPGYSLMFINDRTTPHGKALWKTDGTAVGTAELKDINPGVTTDTNLDGSSTGPEGARALTVGTKFFFGYNDQINGYQLWVSDGTNAGTQMVKNITGSTLTSDLDQFTAFGSQLLFTAQTNLGTELWISDGTSGGTNLVKDILPGAGSSQPNNLMNFGTKVLFTATNPATGFPTVFITDGTSGGTIGFKQAQVKAAGIYATASLVPFNNKIYFAANDHTYGNQIWQTDSTYSGRNLNANMTVDIFPNSGCTVPTSLMLFNSSLFFVATDATHGQEIFYSDGTASGTQILKDIYPGTIGSSPGLATSLEINGKLYFSASDPNGAELWVTDGTLAGTQLLKDINPGATSSNPSNLTRFGNKFIFTASTATNGTEPWISDGTLAGTQLLKDINSGAAGSYPTGYKVFGSLVLFLASDNVNGQELWVTDGTTAGTQLLKDIYPGATGSNPTSLTLAYNKLFFVAEDNVNGIELWVTDGTTAGTQLLKDIYPGASGSIPYSLTLVNNKLFFVATDNVNGAELWVTDGTSLGTTLVKDIYPGITGSAPGNFTIFGSQLLFAAPDPVNKIQLWISDGTTAGTIRLTSLNTSGTGIVLGQSIIYKNKVYFSMSDGINASKLWTTDGTVAGTVMINDYLPATGATNPTNFTIANGHLYYMATTPDRGIQVFMIE